MQMSCLRCSTKTVSSSVEVYIMLPEVKHLNSGVQIHSMASIKLMKELGIRCHYEMFVYSKNNNFSNAMCPEGIVNQVEYR